MEKKGFKWQMCVGAVFMIIIIISLFLPSMSISGEKYLKTAVQINKYAKDEDSKTAKKAQVDKKVIDKYKENTSKWDDKVKEFDDKIDKKDKGSSISQIMLVKWLFTADDEIDDIEGITKKAGEKKSGSKSAQNTGILSAQKASAKMKKSSKKSTKKSTKKTTTKQKSSKSKNKAKKSTAKKSNSTKKSAKKLSDSDVKNVFKIMAILLLIPVLLAVASLIVIAVTGKTNQIMMIATGAVTVVARLIYSFMIPGMIWDKIDDYVKSITLVDARLFDIDGVGKYAVSKIMSNCTGAGVYVTLVAGVFLIVAGILFMTALKPEMEKEESEEEWDFGHIPSIPPQPINPQYPYDPPMPPQHDDGKNQIFTPPTPNPDGYVGEDGKHYMTGMPPEDFVSENYAGDMTVAGEDIGTGAEPEPGGYKPTPGMIPKSGCLYGMEGEYSSSELVMNDGDEVILGRDPKCATLVFSYPKISRRHCGIRYNGTEQRYYVIDYSSNGIEFSNGTKAIKGQYVSVAPGTILYMAGRHEAIKLG